MASSTTAETAADDLVTMQEAVEALQSEEEESIAVFGAGDENNCTYMLGYMDRQAIFSCKTCDPLTENPAGVCYACSLNCHHNHELVELYTKRNFKCDCGNSKFMDFKCKLQENKMDVNEMNKYNHNFSGKYCTCERPYPDPDDQTDDEMIQCIICEDWYHSRHLGCLPPISYEEMICDACVSKHSFLFSYSHLTDSAPVMLEKTDGTESVDVTTSSPTKGKRKYEEENHEQQSSSSCKLKKNVPSDEKPAFKAMYFKEEWRKELCQCTQCLAMYDMKGLSYLINESDTIAAYEKIGKENASKVMENAANTISQMNRVQQVELMQGYNELKEGLHDFLRGFQDKQKVVRKEDIEEFFEDLNKRKRQRQMAPPDSCR